MASSPSMASSSVPSMASPPSKAKKTKSSPKLNNRSTTVSIAFLNQFSLLQGTVRGLPAGHLLKFSTIVDQDSWLSSDDQVMYRIPLPTLLEIAPWTILMHLVTTHGVHLVHGRKTPHILEAFKAHTCVATCHRLCVVLEGAKPDLLGGPQNAASDKHKLDAPAAYQSVFALQAAGPTQVTHIIENPANNRTPTGPADTCTAPTETPEALPDEPPPSSPFPPKPLPISERIKIIREWCDRIGTQIEDDICACCAQLVQKYTISRVPIESSLLLPLADPHRPPGTNPRDHLILCTQGITEKREVKLCPQCKQTLSRKTFPRDSLANGLSLGEIPSELQDLNFVEKLVISKYRHYVSVVRVSRGGQRKLAGNAIVFAQPVEKFYNILPPPRADLNDCLSVLFTGATRPTYEDFKRTPLLVRRRVVQRALTWLMSNHPAYADVKFSQKNLDTYSEEIPPVNVVFRPQKDAKGNIPEENLPVYATSSDGGTEDGICSFAVSGLTGEELDDMTTEEKKLFALKALNASEPVVAYGRSSEPESIYNNPNLYPGMFPWLFPYGSGGFKNALMRKKLGRRAHTKWLLMYHDRRFQTDPYFPFLVFNHDQIDAGVRGGWLTTKKCHFDNVVERIVKLNPTALVTLINRAKEIGHTIPETEEEKKCCSILPLIEHASARVEGSMIQRKYQRNEIKAVTFEKGLPIFFITFAPVDFKNPICLHYCGRDVNLAALSPAIKNAGDRLRAIAENPVACARFFDTMVNLFLDVVLRTKRNEDGLFGPTNGYYGTVESQGRLTLHLHLLLWIKNSDSPKEIREKAKANEQDYQRRLIEWLESCHQGEFSSGSEKEIGERLRKMRKEKKSYSPSEIVKMMKEIERKRELAKAAAKDGSLSPSDEEQPDSQGKTAGSDAEDAAGSDDEDDEDEDDEDDEEEEDVENESLLNPTLMLPSKVPDFKCPEDERDFWLYLVWMTDEVVYRSNRHDRKHRYGCKRGDNCRARYPRDLRAVSQFLEDNGALLMKKGEPWINTFSIVLSYLLRCNTDVTCLLSGTQAKAIIAYVTDYITKMSLKTHSVFEAVKAVLDKHTHIMGTEEDELEVSRRLLTKIVNILTSRTEIGGPMLCAHLLGIPDHYTDMVFKVVYWYQYVLPVAWQWDFDLSGDPDEQQETEDTENVLLKSDEAYGILPWSKVNHYVFRPPAFEKYSLYDFLRLTDVKKMTKTDKKVLIPVSAGPKQEGGQKGERKEGPPDDGEINPEVVVVTAMEQPNQQTQPDRPETLHNAEGDPREEHEVDDSHCYQFQDQHPNQETHAVFRLKGDRSYILNYVGAPLPRRKLEDIDADQRERYCMVMLTLFAPWRTGRELKREDESFWQAFRRTDFTSRASEVMGNMNLLYECYDASHDFSTQRRRDELRALVPSSISGDSGDFGNGNDVLQGMFGGLDQNFVNEALAMSSGDLGDELEVVQSKLGYMKTTMTRLLQAGDAPATIVPSQAERVAVDDLRTVGKKSPTEWRSELGKAKERFLEQRNATLRPLERAVSSPDNPTEPPTRQVTDSEANKRPIKEGAVVVTSVDSLPESEQRLLAKAPDAAVKEVIKEIALQFSLNVDQNRAYELVVDALLKDNDSDLDNSILDPLRLYLGGIRGTGKSQVVKSVLAFLERRGESYKCIVLAPTGSAACLVDGSTYHSALSLSIDTEDDVTQGRFTQVVTRFKMVRLIIIDEVSMLSCTDLYRINYQLSSAFKSSKTFAGRHVLLAGDFGQLPPVLGRCSWPLYSARVPLSVLAKTTDGQKAAEGKSLWHLFTTVVILRINMRQRGESEADQAFRTALGNMRYGKCTQADIDLLNSRIVGSPSVPTLSDPRFRNVSVITAFNYDRDAINSVSCQRFALESGQPLVRFFSRDSWPKPIISSKKAKKSKKSKKKLKQLVSAVPRRSGPMTPAEQRFLWELPPNQTKHIAGVLELCIGMPVLLKHNEATEICATNGAEGIVVGWDSESVGSDRHVLDTLFVLLKSPPREIQIPGLPKNVVPIAACTEAIHGLVPPKGEGNYSRKQVRVLPNFAMMDYASQGRTRPHNVVDPRNLKTHQSFYTALSRSSTLDGTLLLFPVDSRKITKGCTGDLRREYRELEILDDMTRMRHEGTVLHTKIPQGGHRSLLIKWYRETFGSRHVPVHVHPALNWSQWRREELEDEVEFSYYELVEAFAKKSTKDPKAGDATAHSSNQKPNAKRGSSTRGANAKSGSIQKPSTMRGSTRDANVKSGSILNPRANLKRGTDGHKGSDFPESSSPSKKSKTGHVFSDVPKPASQSAPKRALDDEWSERASKKPKLDDIPLTPSPSSSQYSAPVGLLWDWNNWSCAYDALICILFNTFIHRESQWELHVKGCSPYLDYLRHGFQTIVEGSRTLEMVRNDLRDVLHRRNHVYFPRLGPVPTELSRLCEEIFKTSQPITSIRSTCMTCQQTHAAVDSQCMVWPCPRSTLRHHPTLDALSTSVKMSDLLQAAVQWHIGNNRACNTCSLPDEPSVSLHSEISWNTTPPLWVLEVQRDTEDGFDWLNMDGCAELSSPDGTMYDLIGVVYSGTNHFTCRYRDPQGNFWSHDSAQHLRFMRQDTTLPNRLGHIGDLDGRMACAWMYLRR